MENKELNIYKKMQSVKKKLIEANLKKTGENKYAGFKYYELSDFLPTIAKLCDEIGLFTKIDFDFANDDANLTIVNIDKPEETLVYHSPIRNLELKGCNQIQALGGVQTYSRRYLYMNAFDITENDMFDSKDKESNSASKVVETKATENQLTVLRKYYQAEQLAKLLEANNIQKLEDMPLKKASQLIKAIKEREAMQNGTSQN
jgi:hypothetical protein